MPETQRHWHFSYTSHLSIFALLPHPALPSSHLRHHAADPAYHAQRVAFTAHFEPFSPLVIVVLPVWERIHEHRHVDGFLGTIIHDAISCTIGLELWPSSLNETLICPVRIS